MGKSGRKNKEKKKDFQKVKLKVGKTKPAANNVTKATFKTGGVLIREQLKQDDSQPTTLRKQNIHDLLCQLNHYNFKVRQDSIWGMKELLTNHPELMSEHLALLLDNLCTLFTDKHAPVRKATISLLALLFGNTNENDMSPFMSVLIVYLCSAMTHINEDIQLDSLSILDLCLDFYPKLIVPHNKELLMNFVSQITRQRSMKPDFENADLELLVNPDRKMTSQSWRLKVLERLRKFLQSLLETRKADEGAIHDSEMIAIRWNEANRSRPLHFKPFLMEGFTLRSLTDDKSGSNHLSSTDDIVSFVNTVIPLLMQSWMEVSPSLLHKGNGVPHVAIGTLEAVLCVLCLLLKWLEEICKEKDDYKPLTSLVAQHKKEFSQRLFTSFPFVEHNHSSNKRKKGSKSSVQTSNLALAEIMTYFIKKQQHLKGWLERLHDHLVDELECGNYCSADQVHSVLNVVQRLILVLKKPDVGVLLEALCESHKNLHQRSQARGILLRFLAGIAMKDFHFESVNNWVSNLPNELLRLRSGKSCDTSDIIQVISTAASRGHHTVLQGLQENILKFMNRKDGLVLHVTDAEQRRLVQLLYWVPNISRDLLQELAITSMDERLTCENVACALQLLTTRCLESKIPAVEELLSCLLTSSLGVTMEILTELQELSSTTPKSDNEGSLFIRPPTYCDVTLKSCDSQHYHRQVRICEIICSCFKQLENNGNIWRSFQIAIHNLLMKRKTLPITAAQSILRTLSFLHSDKYDILEGLQQNVAQCCLASLLGSVPLYAVLYQNDHWANDLWTVCVDTLLKMPNMLHIALELIDYGIPDVLNEDDIYKTAVVIVRLLQTHSLSSYLVAEAPLLQRISHNIQNHHFCPKESQWKVELCYELSLLPSSASKK
ncbi:testis-expressed protein 10-like [Anneissia japonica]|uniref:testis-expressed protein 10-like n=1 Tax=Anneissia japonica TaxID=1529436 RepID=UPI00142553D7|nr:testis-expressed protein 10-like [Anneissia japonica]XP_033110248.1 testis-expressed protein 10-like [Anneissia japonica]